MKSKNNKFDIVHAHNVPSALPMKVAKGRKILTIHGYYSEQIGLLHGKTLGTISDFLEPKILRWADIITVVSKEQDGTAATDWTSTTVAVTVIGS